MLSAHSAEALFAPSPKFAASAYVIYDCLAAALRLPRAASKCPPVYAGVWGQYGLAECSWQENGWRKMGLNPVVGARFVTETVTSFQAACEHIFPEGKYDGFYLFDDEDDGWCEQPASADVVCIRCATATSAGRHTLIKENAKVTREDRDGYVLPPFAAVTLVSIQHTWRVRRQTMRCRLFTCEVTFDLF